MTIRPATISIYLADGTPEGLRTIEKTGWTGLGLVVPRSLLAQARTRREFAKPGVYVLAGSALAAEPLPRVYVGEGDPAGARIVAHEGRRDWWTTAILFTSKDENLNKAHVQFLEARLVALARAAGRSRVDNDQDPALPSLSEREGSEASAFCDEILLCMPILGVMAFTSPVASGAQDDLRLTGTRGAAASGYDSPQGFVVRRGSTVQEATPAAPDWTMALRSSLVASGVLRQEGSLFRFSQDFVFGSATAAASLVLGYSENGRKVWKNKDGVSLSVLQSDVRPGPSS